MNNPLVTINILSFNRKDDLRITLTKVFEQDYRNIEVIVVDNASTDGTQKMVKEEYPYVKLVELKENIGIAGWNKGFELAQGEYILVLDDDSYPLSQSIKYAIANIVEEDNIGIIACNILNNRHEQLIFDSSLYFIGCGALFKKVLINNLGGFHEDLFIYEHEIEFSMRAFNYGYKISFCSDAQIIHNVSNTNRTTGRRKRYVTRNILFILFFHFNISKVWFRMIRIITGRIFSGIKKGDFLSITRGVFGFILLSLTHLNSREVLSIQTQKKYLFGAYAAGYHFKDGDWYN